jgi:hypothetical protein
MYITRKPKIKPRVNFTDLYNIVLFAAKNQLSNNQVFHGQKKNTIITVNTIIIHLSIFPNLYFSSTE